MNDFKVFTTVESLQLDLQSRKEAQKIGFVPTMGALHHGHLSLVKKAFSRAEIVVVSVFVNPKQFNKLEDLKEYPRDLEKDIELISTAGNVIIFAPTVAEIYPSTFSGIELELGALATVMEGKYRNGHFNGVVNVVKRFFEIVQPDFAFFGEKDFQQLAVIRFMANELKMPVEVVGCSIVREKSGLASSSRNERLSEKQKNEAVVLSISLRIAKELASVYSPFIVKELIADIVDKSNLELEYFEIVNPETLQPIVNWVPGSQGCLAAYCGEVRLIDNMQLTDV